MMDEMSVTTPPKSAASPSRKESAATTAAHPVLGSYGRVAAWLSKRVEVALGTVDLTLPQFRVLGILAEGSSAASGLADRLAVRRPSITALIDGLVARGLVHRRQEDTDRRRVELRLTDDGARILADSPYLAGLRRVRGSGTTTAIGRVELPGAVHRALACVLRVGVASLGRHVLRVAIATAR